MGIATQEMDTLNHYQNNDGVVSLYVSSASEDSLATYQGRLDNMAKTAHEQLVQMGNSNDSPIIKVLKKAVSSLVDEFISGESQTRCVFISKDLCKTVSLPIALPDRVLVDDFFYTHPLNTILVQFERFAVAIFDHHQVRLFTFHLGQLDENKSLFHTYELPKTCTDTSPWDHLKERRICYRIEDSFHRHLRVIADTIASAFESLDVDKLMFGAPQGISESMNRHLSTNLQEVLASTFIANVDDPLETLTRKVYRGFLKYRSKKESQKTLTLLEKRSDNRTVFGAAPVVDALLAGKVQELVLTEDFHTSGLVCPKGHIQPESSSIKQTCPACGNVCEEVTNVKDYILEEALAQHVDLFHLMVDKDRLEEHQIAAFLRF
ncbi:hypothetical protein ACFL6U_26015 [Planctomycetota bacterium]